MNLAALASSNFRLYYFGAISSVNGLWILRIIIGWLAWDLTASASFVGFIAATSLLPTFLSGPLFGVLVDRANIKLAAYLTNTGMTVLAVTLLTLQHLSLVSNLSLAAIALGLGLVSSAHHPVRMSLAPRLVDRAHVASVIALAAINFNLARMISPAIGGLLIDQFGIELALWITIALYLPNFALIAFLRPRRTSISRGSESFSKAFMIGLSHAWTTRTARQILMLTGIFSLSIRGIMEILPVIADGSFERGVAGLGQLSAAVGAGALTAAILIATGSPNNGQAVPRSVLWAAPVGMISVALLGLTASWPFALLAAGILGFCGTFVGVKLQSALQSALADDMRGRVMSIWVVVSLTSTAVGAFLVGASAEFFGLGVSTVIAAGSSFVLLLWVILAFHEPAQ